MLCQLRRLNGVPVPRRAAAEPNARQLCERGAKRWQGRCGAASRAGCVDTEGTRAARPGRLPAAFEECARAKNKIEQKLVAVRTLQKFIRT